MSETRQIINKVLSELEDGVKSTLHNSKSVEQVMEILLGRKTEMNQPLVNVDNEPLYTFDMEELRLWQERNNQIYHIPTDYSLNSDKAIIGRISTFIKQVVRKMIRPIISPIVTRQNEFNASVTASINALYNNEVVTKAFIKAQENYNVQIEQMKEEIASLKRKETDDVYSIIDYSKFESHFRGSEETIKKSLRQYVPCFEGKQKVVDLGCGRGEFLELLKESNISAIGVDTYAKFVDECQKKKLNVVQADALSYLCNRADEELDGIFASQLIEHLKTCELATLCKVAYEKLKFGGCLVFETPNPTCLLTFTSAFYIDPTHNKPVHPKMLEYFLRNVGFTTVEVVYTDDSRADYRLPLLNIKGMDNLQDVNDAINLLTDVIFGSQNYAIIATK